MFGAAVAAYSAFGRKTAGHGASNPGPGAQHPNVDSTAPSGAILYYSAQWSHPPSAWKAAVCAHFDGPGTPSDTPLDFRSFDPEVPGSLGDLTEIHYALVYGAPHGLLASLPNLKVTLSVASGIDHVLNDPTYPHGAVPVLRMVDQNQMAMMGEYAVWAVLDHHRAMGVYRQQQRDHVYNRVTTSYTPAVSILVLGLGYMGTEIATKLATFGFDVRGWSRSHKDVANVACHAGQAALFDAAAVGCHYVINALPLTPETTAVLNDRLFRKLHRGACVINMGRGGHVVTRDLLTCLSNGQLSHAYLDVFDDEPLPKDHPIWDHPQVTVTPHIAGELLPASCAVSVAANIRKYSASAMAAVEPGVS